MESAYGLPKKREAVVKALQNAYTEGNLEEMEYENRLSTAYEAKTIAALKEVIYDFPAFIQAEIFPAKGSTRNTKITTGFSDRHPSMPTNTNVRRVLFNEDALSVAVITEKMERFSVLMGSVKILAENSQIQTNTPHFHIDCWLGNAQFNLVNPELAGKEVHLYIHGGLSEVKIFVPPGTQISRRISIVLGEFTHKKRMNLMGIFKKSKQPIDNNLSFHLIIHGSFVLGSVHVRY